MPITTTNQTDLLKALEKDSFLDKEQKDRLSHELAFMQIIQDVQDERKTLDKPIEWWFNTPDHPFEMYLEQLYKKSNDAIADKNNKSAEIENWF